MGLILRIQHGINCVGIGIRALGVKLIRTGLLGESGAVAVIAQLLIERNRIRIAAR